MQCTLDIFLICFFLLDFVFFECQWCPDCLEFEKHWECTAQNGLPIGSHLLSERSKLTTEFGPGVVSWPSYLRRTPPRREALRHSGGESRRWTSPTVTLYLDVELSSDSRPGTEQKTSLEFVMPPIRLSLASERAERPLALEGMGTVEQKQESKGQRDNTEPGTTGHRHCPPVECAR